MLLHTFRENLKERFQIFFCMAVDVHKGGPDLMSLGHSRAPHHPPAQRQRFGDRIFAQQQGKLHTERRTYGQGAEQKETNPAPTQIPRASGETTASHPTAQPRNEYKD